MTSCTYWTYFAFGTLNSTKYIKSSGLLELGTFSPLQIFLHVDIITTFPCVQILTCTLLLMVQKSFVNFRHTFLISMVSLLGKKLKETPEEGISRKHIVISPLWKNHIKGFFYQNVFIFYSVICLNFSAKCGGLHVH